MRMYAFYVHLCRCVTLCACLSLGVLVPSVVCPCLFTFSSPFALIPVCESAFVYAHVRLLC